MTSAPEIERPCTPRKRLELAKEVDRETTALLNKDGDAAQSAATTANASASAAQAVETPRELRDFCETFVGTVVKQASRRFG